MAMSMKTDLLDKFLILLLISMLPTAIFITSQNQELEGGNAKKAAEAEQKIHQAIQQLQASKPVDVPKAAPITIDKISYATESGELTITGVAPGRNLNVMVSATVLPHKKTTPAPTTKSEIDTTSSSSSAAKASSLDDAVLGESVEVVAVKADVDGKFTLVKKVDFKKTDLVELRFDQADSTATVQYSIQENKRLY